MVAVFQVEVKIESVCQGFAAKEVACKAFQCWHSRSFDAPAEWLHSMGGNIEYVEELWVCVCWGMHMRMTRGASN